MEITKNAAVCGECRENPSKYRCPGCSLRSCSLQCVKSHKQRTGCTGKRSLTDFVPLSQFDDDHLLSDYNLLEETKRVTESSQRKRVKLFETPQFHHLRQLRFAARKRRIKLLILSAGMSKRLINHSRYDESDKFISWTVEWRFHSTDVVLHDHGVNEDSNLTSVVEKHLEPGPWSHKLKKFCEVHLESLKFFIRLRPERSKSAFRELDINAPLKHQLVNIVILEYPVIHVFLPSHRYDFEVVKYERRISGSVPETRNCVNKDHPFQNGVTFREEKIEDDCVSEPKVYDLMNNLNTGQFNETHHSKDSKEGFYQYFDGPLSVKKASGNESHASFNSVASGGLDLPEFDFDQGLIDAYSDIIGDINPDDFLDFEDEFSMEALGEGNFDPDLGGILADEQELEDGEIAE